jgi:hypothetical protein
MTPFDEILNTIEQVHLKYPEVPFGKILDCLISSNEQVWNLSDEQVLLRLKYILTREV